MVEQDTSNWRPRSAWTGIVEPGQIGTDGKPGVVATALDDMGFATLIEPAGLDNLEHAIKRMIGLDLPRRPSVSLSRTHGVAWAGINQWLLIARQREGFADLVGALSDHAAVSDQSHGRAALRVSGPKVREVLAKGVMVDLHSSLFPVGATARTSIAYIDVQFWRAEDGPDGPIFEILMPRSMAGSFWSWFAASAGEFGCCVRRD
ncbi:sarcosine oxidase subunit gamma [Bradyrhizobium sp. 183]|uniref:sarcosine oxidase subunit gamma n=1 Tax=unclassified Bradyrhizobium TaxID=2631580 RepID=UPI001FFFFB3C|nr:MULTISPECIES: sarcosine oxidase subunit gamma family protein [unclassified Bradyrhizobium]UPJ79379.1 sarcosine oxidase subunit gamma [Bradyrhizobium sp. 184]UPJ87173.1 sarcosine oxidase subunit gamma [Bradyrhizobium sp. 183]